MGLPPILYFQNSTQPPNRERIAKDKNIVGNLYSMLDFNSTMQPPKPKKGLKEKIQDDTYPFL